jgi:O-antigen/teichoic acid export membrane protein
VTVSAAAERPAETSAAQINLAPTAVLLFSANALQYIIIGLTGVILARALGPDGRGVYGLINETALMAAAFPGLALEFAGIHLVGRKRAQMQDVFSNSFSWGLVISAICLLLIPVALITDTGVFGMGSLELSIALMGASFMTLGDGPREFLLPLNRTVAYTSLSLVAPAIRLVGTIVVVVTIGLSVDSAGAVWLLSFGAMMLLTLSLLARNLHIRPGIEWKSLRAQASFGARGHFGWILQALNHRLDVFMIGAMVGTSGVGHYLVGVNLAELTWWIPLALGTALFPKASAMDSKDNFEMSAVACRRTLIVTVMAGLGLLAVAPLAIPIVYGGEFGPSVGIFLILLPSGLFYTIHKVLGSSLSAHGMPQATLFAGFVSLPFTVGLNLLLIPRWEIVGAAVASDIAYLVNAAVILALFLKASGLNIREILLFNGSDIEAVRWNLQTKILSRLHKDEAPATEGL